MDEMDKFLKKMMMSNESVTFNAKIFQKNEKTNIKHNELDEITALLNEFNNKVDDLSNQIKSKKTQYDELSKNKDKDNNADNNADILKNIVIEIRELIDEKKKCLCKIDKSIEKQKNLIKNLKGSR